MPEGRGGGNCGDSSPAGVALLNLDLDDACHVVLRERFELSFDTGFGPADFAICPPKQKRASMANKPTSISVGSIKVAVNTQKPIQVFRMILSWIVMSLFYK